MDLMDYEKGSVVSVHTIKEYRGNRGTALLNRNLCTRYTLQELYPWNK